MLVKLSSYLIGRWRGARTKPLFCRMNCAPRAAALYSARCGFKAAGEDERGTALKSVSQAIKRGIFAAGRCKVNTRRRAASVLLI